MALSEGEGGGKLYGSSPGAGGGLDAFTALETLGIDEVALLKGHGHDMAVIWMRAADGQNHVLAVLPDRLQVTVHTFGNHLGHPENHSMAGPYDLWESYASAVVATLPDARIVVNRSHMAMQYRKVFVDRRARPNASVLTLRGPPSASGAHRRSNCSSTDTATWITRSNCSAGCG